MSGLPWFKCYPRDFNDGMTGLTMEERGAYTTILFSIYAKGAPIEDDPGYFRALLCCSPKAWLRVRAALIVKRKLYEVNVNGLPCLMNRRAAEVIAERLAEYRKFSEAGARGGKNRGGQLKENNDLGQAPLEPGLSPPQANRTEAEAEQNNPPHPPCGGASDATLSVSFERAFAAYPESGRAATTPAKARDAWMSAAKDVGPERLVSAVESFARSDFAKEGGGRRVPSFHRWLSEARYTAFLSAASQSQFAGPDELRRAVLAEKGEGWCKAYLDPCGWVPDRGLIPRTGTAAEKLAREIPHILKRFNILMGQAA